MANISKGSLFSSEFSEKNKGWIKLHRVWLDHWLYNSNKPKTKREAWEDMLLLVNHTDTEVPIGNEIFICYRGQSMRSLESWAKQFNWNKSKVRRFFNQLSKSKLIVVENIQISTRVTICGYDIYQGDRNVSETQMKHKRNATETQATPNKNEKNYKNEKEEEITPSKIHFLDKSDNHDIYTTEI